MGLRIIWLQLFLAVVNQPKVLGFALRAAPGLRLVDATEKLHAQQPVVVARAASSTSGPLSRQPNGATNRNITILLANGERLQLPVAVLSLYEKAALAHQNDADSSSANQTGFQRDNDAQLRELTTIIQTSARSTTPLNSESEQVTSVAQILSDAENPSTTQNRETVVAQRRPLPTKSSQLGTKQQRSLLTKGNPGLLGRAHPHHGGNPHTTATPVQARLEGTPSILMSRLYEIIPVTYRGGMNQLLLPINDEYVSGAIRSSKKPWGEDQLNIMMDYITPGTGVLDIGANLGVYTLYFAQKAAHVTSFEPQPLIFQLLCANVVLNELLNVRVIHTAVSFKSGITHMSINLPDGSSKGRDFNDAFKNKAPINYGGRPLGKGGEVVSMTYLDAMEFKNLSFIKVDVQGSEKLVFYGGRETIRKHLPVINLEFPTQANPFTLTQEMIDDMQIPPEVVNFDIAQFLTSLGYHQARTLGDDSYWEPPGYKTGRAFHRT